MDNKQEQMINKLQQENRQLREKLATLEVQVMKELEEMSKAYEIRLAYIMAKYTDDGTICDDDIMEWGKDKEYAIVATEDDRCKGRVWRVVINDGKSDKRTTNGTTKYS